jgi:hypothetical protein
MRSTGRNHRARRPLAPSPSRFERSRASPDRQQTPAASARLLPPSCGPFRRHGRCCRCAAPHQYGSELGLLCPGKAGKACASVRLRRPLLASAFDLPVQRPHGSRGARRKKDAPMQLQAGRGRALVRSCRARTTGHQNLRIRMVTARPDALTRLQAPAGHLPADSCGLFSLQSACSLRYASGMHVRSRQLLDYFRKAAAGGTCARHHSNRCDLIETPAPEWLPLAACGNAPGVSCMPSDPRAPGRPRATAVALPSHT